MTDITAPAAPADDIILEVKDLSTSFYKEKREGRAVEGLSFSVKRGEILGVVGESGSGKSVTAMSIMRLIKYPPGRIVSGQVLFNGEDLLQKSYKDMLRIRGKQIAMIFQEPMSSLNPVLTIGDQLTEPMIYHDKLARAAAWARATELMELVKIPQARERLKKYPYEMSGGMRQRAMIAMALACNPQLIIADEPTTALDVTIQSQILDLLDDLRQQFNTSIMLITHDMGIVAGMADKILVMYAARLAEYGDTYSILKQPRHPYTAALMESIPKINEEKAVLSTIPGLIPGIYNQPGGCHFHPRCPYATEQCATEAPQPRLLGASQVSCWHADKF